MEVEEDVEHLHKEHLHQHYLKEQEQQSPQTSSLPSSTTLSSLSLSSGTSTSPVALSPTPTFRNTRRPYSAYIRASAAASAATAVELIGPMIRERKQQWLDGPLTNLMLRTYTHRRQPKALLEYKCHFQEVSYYKYNFLQKFG